MAPVELTQSSSTERRKRLGQYFSGIGLARLLAELAGARQAVSIIDPMAGSGDMLVGSLAVGSVPSSAAAIEIDQRAAHILGERLPGLPCVVGSAFSARSIAALPSSQWDLVITNPPYVRYQMQGRASGGNAIPTAIEVRTGLIDSLAHVAFQDATDRELFRTLSSQYSGLADLAVPSWILCAALVRPGGKLAMVLPESWLSRDYAAVVRYLLLRWFDIEWVVEDEHAVWFSEAQVKTHLLVATRVPRRASAFEQLEGTYKRIRLSGSAWRPGAPLGAIGVDEKQFVESIRQELSKSPAFKSDYVQAELVPRVSFSRSIGPLTARNKWLSRLESASPVADGHYLPRGLSDWAQAKSSDSDFICLDDLGVSVGQGLRTGANAFFYGTEVSRCGEEVLFLPDSLLDLGPIKVPADCLRVVVRRQAELPAGFSLRAGSLRSRVLDLNRYALPADLASTPKPFRPLFKKMPRALATYVLGAGQARSSSSSSATSVAQLSAVRTNVRAANVERGIAPRFWYMLPPFAARHSPDVLLPRVNSVAPKAFVNGRGTLVDANFATLSGTELFDKYALCALLNSVWCQVALEWSCSVMGGGALKVEAAHLRLLPVPRGIRRRTAALSTLGKRLAGGEAVMDEVDALVVGEVLGRAARPKDLVELRSMLESGRARRKRPRAT